MSVYKDLKRGTWYTKFRYKDWKGETKWITRRGFPTKREASAWEQNFQIQQNQSIDMSFADFLKVYENDLRLRLRESTWQTKENIIHSKLIPYFGKKAMSEIKASDVIQWHNEMLRHRHEDGRPFAPSYLKTLHNQLSAIFNHAVRFYDLKTNPARKAGNIGTEKGIEMKFWTKKEYQAFSVAMMDKPVSFYAFEMLYWCGIREGELLALSMEDFDFERQTVHIRKSYQRIKNQDIITDPKTPKSKRFIKMPDFLCEEMQEYFNLLYGLKPNDRIFPVTKHYLYNEMKRGVQAQGLERIRIHDLRHSHVSLLIDMGFSAVAIADRMGHESIDITYRYAHLFPSKQTEMAERLNIEREDGSNFGKESRP
jgi:Site-specific recombinase XerD